MYFYDFAFGILGLQPEDAGTYRVSLIELSYDNVHLLHHTYRLVTIYQPSAPLLCEFQDLTSVLDDRNDYKLTCSIRNAYPVIDIKVIEPNECTFESHYYDDGIHSEVTVSITYCEGNSTVGCVAIQRQLEFMSINGYSDSCFWEMTKSNPDKTEYDLQNSLRFKDKLQAEKSFLESKVKILEEKLRSQRQFFCEQEETLRKQWGEMLLIKERDCERYKKEVENMATTLNKSNSIVYKLTAELSNAKKELTSLRNNNLSQKKTMKVLEKSLKKVKQNFTTINAEHEANIQYLESDVKTMEEKFILERKIHSEEAKVIGEIHEEEMTCMKGRMDSQIVAKDELIQSLQSGMKSLEDKLKEQRLFHQDEVKALKENTR
ncbi:hypothetical protein BSL78_15244 [Apostichopus japonicus]|uniref:Uncharacterized protein n=1 Tax=Stichopus japonicus TaxID=307972 RepID=A0A2G8KIP3_STIJA|nr:hypothetical protein BSL78_15244 [Apostichopus japonicus]